MPHARCFHRTFPNTSQLPFRCPSQPPSQPHLTPVLFPGCQVASWGGYLLQRGILTVSMAPRDEHEAQVQFALERGLPAVLGIFASIRQPYPARSFDLVQCSRCLIPWHADGELGGMGGMGGWG